MKKYLLLLKRLKKIPRYNLLILMFVGVTIIVATVLIYKFFNTKPTYIYAKVKVGQGLWWATTQKPDYWFIKSIKKGEKEVDLVGRPLAEIVNYSYYPVLTEDSYPRLDIFITVRLKTTFDSKNNHHIFKRDVVSVGSPIEFQFPSVNITGTVIDFGEKETKIEYVEKTVYLYNFNAYQKDFPYIYENIKVGEQYYNGREVILKVEDKELLKSVRLPSDIWGRIYEQENDTIQHILVKAKIKLIQSGKQLIYAEERPIKVGVKAPFITESFSFEDFWIVRIE